MDVHLLCVLSRPRQPQANRYFGMAEEPLSIRDGQPEMYAGQVVSDGPTAAILNDAALLEAHRLEKP